MQRVLVFVLCLVVGCCSIVEPASARRRRTVLPRWEWHLDASLAAVYNDNLLRLSERDQDQFQRDPGIFPVSLETTDDLETEFSLAPSLNWRAPMTLMVSGDYRIKAVTRARNGFTDYQTHALGVSVRPRVKGYRWSARFRVFAIPSFYLRAYRDRDWNEYHAARFSNWDYEGSVRYRVLNPLWLTAKLAWGSYYYNAKFTEYDSEYLDLTAGASYDLPWNVGISGAYTRRTSDNIGQQGGTSPTYIPSGEDPIEDTEYGDANFNEDEFNAAVSTRIPWASLKRVQADVSYRLRRRVYTTDRVLEQDPFHRGRLDKRGQFTTSISTPVVPKLRAQAYFTYEVRRTESEWPSVPDVKNFVRREFGLAFSYSIR
ncbi:hypothetical protein KKH27_06795 [bacterium]|nr:hypothetical protein [bacterium]MBU1983746.1 hypothetical protein [bacterium]